MGQRADGSDDPVDRDLFVGAVRDTDGAPVDRFLEHDNKLAADAVGRLAKPVYTLQCVIGETNEKRLADLLDSESHEMELYAFVGQFLNNDEAHQSLFNRTADFRNKCMQAAKLLREIECDVDRLAQTIITMGKGPGP